MDTLQKLGLYGLIPVISLDSALDALPVADALTAGGLPVMEVTLRTEAGLESIRRIAAVRPNIEIGAGTVLNVDQAKSCVDAGARFIVSPGTNTSVLEWCIDNKVAVLPGCVTPTEITLALSYGINIVKFFPASVYGGLPAMKALSAPFNNVKFIPTGGVDLENLGEFASMPFIHAIGGSFMCPKADIQAHNYNKIEATTRECIRTLMGFSMNHIGINTSSDIEAESVCKAICTVFGFDFRSGKSSNFAGSSIEVVKGNGLGEKGHIAITSNNISRAAAYLESHGVLMNWESLKEKNGRINAVYLKEEFAGFAVHLIQK